MIDFSGLLSTDYQANIFSSISLENERSFVSPKKVELLDLFITEYPRHCEDDLQPTQFTFSYFDQNKVDFLKHQNNVQIFLNEILGHTKPLNEFEQSVLNKSYKKSLKSTPSRPNRL